MLQTDRQEYGFEVVDDGADRPRERHLRTPVASEAETEVGANFVKPTIFDDVDPNMKIAREEIFDVSKAHRIAKAIKAGTVWINTYNLCDPALPFGGFKESGFGRDQGKDALEKYTQTKSVCVNL